MESSAIRGSIVEFKKVAVVASLALTLAATGGCARAGTGVEPEKAATAKTEPSAAVPAEPEYTPEDPQKYYTDVAALVKGQPPLSENYEYNAEWMLDVLRQAETMSNPHDLSEDANYRAALQQLMFLAQADVATDGKVSEYWYTLQPTEEASIRFKEEVAPAVEAAVAERNSAEVAPILRDLMKRNPNMSDRADNVEFALYYISGVFDKELLKEMNAYNNSFFYE